MAERVNQFATVRSGLSSKVVEARAARLGSGEDTKRVCGQRVIAVCYIYLSRYPIKTEGLDAGLHDRLLTRDRNALQEGPRARLVSNARTHPSSSSVLVRATGIEPGVRARPLSRNLERAKRVQSNNAKNSRSQLRVPRTCASHAHRAAVMVQLAEKLHHRLRHSSNPVPGSYRRQQGAGSGQQPRAATATRWMTAAQPATESALRRCDIPRAPSADRPHASRTLCLRHVARRQRQLGRSRNTKDADQVDDWKMNSDLAVADAPHDPPARQWRDVSPASVYLAHHSAKRAGRGSRGEMSCRQPEGH